MNVTPRLKRILTVMLEQDRVMAVKELAEEVGVSQRPEKASGSKEHRKKRSACWKS